MTFKNELTIVVILMIVAYGSFGITKTKIADVQKLIVTEQLSTLLEPYKEKPFELGERTKTSDCQINGPLPDSECTPGSVFPEATREIICVKGYTKTVRSVSVATKRKIYTAYGISYPQPTGSYEADHLIPLELGGDNDIANLFPESQDPRPGFREKDLVENYLNEEVCTGRIELGAAQQQIATDWVSVYNALTPDQINALKREFLSY